MTCRCRPTGVRFYTHVPCSRADNQLPSIPGTVWFHVLHHTVIELLGKRVYLAPRDRVLVASNNFVPDRTPSVVLLSTQIPILAVDRKGTEP